MRRDGIEGRRCGRIVYGPWACDVAAASAAEPSGSHSDSDSRRRICPKSCEPFAAAVPAWNPRYIQAGGADHECESGALTGGETCEKGETCETGQDMRRSLCQAISTVFRVSRVSPVSPVPRRS